MEYGMYVSAAGAHAQSVRMDVLTNNMANVDTVGFKGELLVLEAQSAEAMRYGQDYHGSRSANDIGGGVAARETLTDFAQGALKRTGVPTDFAIKKGEGFFLVEKEGDMRLTRAGNFQRASSGELTNQQGYRLLAQDRTPVRLVAGPGQWRLLENGMLEQPEGNTPLAIVQAQPGDLVRRDSNLFESLGPIDDAPQSERQVASGFLEMSTVTPVQAMMQLIQTSRAYEANIRMIQSQDQAIGSLLGRLLRQ